MDNQVGMLAVRVRKWGFRRGWHGKLFYVPYEALQCHSAVYKEEALVEVVVQPVDLMANHVVTPAAFEQFQKAVARCGPNVEDVASAWTTPSENKVSFCVTAAALGCRGFVSDVLRAEEGVNSWDGGVGLNEAFVTAAYHGVLLLTDAAGQLLTVEQRAASGANLLLQWVACKVGTTARKLAEKGDFNWAGYDHVAELVAGYEMSERELLKFIFEARREINRPDSGILGLGQAICVC